jgi:hypothetical protein
MYTRNNIHRTLNDAMSDFKGYDVIVYEGATSNRWCCAKNRYGSTFTIFDEKDNPHDIMKCVDEELEKQEGIVLLNPQEQMDKLMVLV